MDKITSFVLRNNRSEILLFQHEDYTIQLPAGSIENGEDILDAGVREAIEETEINKNAILGKNMINCITNDLENNEVVIEVKADLYSRPIKTSMKWCAIPRGITVQKIKENSDFIQVKYEDWNNELEKDYITFGVLGWIEKANIGFKKNRHYCMIDVNDSRNEWEVKNDHHVFYCRWIPIDKLPQDIYPNNKWIKVLIEEMKKDRRTIAST